MSALLDMKKWLTVTEATKYISNIMGEFVCEADIFQLVLNRNLKLSIHFVNHAEVRHGEVVPLSKATMKKVPSLDGKSIINVMAGIRIDEDKILELEKEVTTIEGIWSLPMIGNERLDIEHAYQQLTGGPAVTLQGIDGAFVQGHDEELYQLQEHFSDNEYFDQNNIKSPWNHRDNFYPAGGLPKDSVFVVTRESLLKFKKAFSKSNDDQKEYEESFDKAVKLGEVKDEISKLKVHINSLTPADPQYLERKKNAEHEIAKLMVKKDKLDEYFSTTTRTDTDEDTEERDLRLQQRANQIFSEGKTKKQVCMVIWNEEKTASKISEARLMTIIRKPKNIK